ncbi:MAG TPA: tRNA (N6-isopentenyl adenosine(37)-C2)-methylthiotransferase MiaB [Acidimicrobiia bacterium]|nr:tRNA (N6-isopentenyl adenosine(37)-C2)-methylthiotransferase MiaB [Acidimicrobiia bacterium]
MTTTVGVASPTRRSLSSRLPTRTGKRYHIRTFGCQMNEHDSERIAGLLDLDGMTSTSDLEAADVLFINTCTIREAADNRLYGNLGQLKEWKDRRPESLLVVGGCAAQKDRELLRKRAPWVDVVMGTNNLDRILDLIDYAEAWGGITEVVDELEAMPSSLPVRRELAHSAWVSIQVGCNNTCTFCIVPSVRGKEVSRRPGDVLSEIRALASQGVIEVTLLGQNVDTYGRDLALDGRRRPLFADLLRQVGSIEGISRVRFTSPHPADFRRDVAMAMAETEAVCEQLHLPLQSGSDRVLAAMHRGYNTERYWDKLNMARELIPNLSVSTDIIVGFPGETEDDFQATLDLVQEACFDQAFMFIFSPRPGTRAAMMTDQFVPEDVIADRFGRLVAIQNESSLKTNQAMVGGRYEVLTEGPSKKDASISATRTRGGKLVHIPGTFEPGRLLQATILSAAPHHLVGRVT